ncbi:hypothetical protein [Streptosporangium sp. NPDC006930]|uniref:hypothetical protein n=1 Tax=unclassified Streptosporangium TaxID=2632669 RepID=UPI0034252AA1
MSKAVGEQERAPGSRQWRAVRIAASVALPVLLGMGLAWVLVDPLDLQKDILEMLSQRASVIGTFTGAAGLVVAMLALRAQLRSRPVDDIASTTGTPGSGQAESAHARGPRRRTVLLITTVSAVVVTTLIALAVVSDASVRYEAEDGSCNNARRLYNIDDASNNASMGHLNYPDSWVEIKVYAPRADIYKVNVRYSAADGDARQYLTVNGSRKIVVHYPGSPTWTTWSHASATLKLDHKWNTLRFQHDDGPFAAELDYVEIVGGDPVRDLAAVGDCGPPAAAG